MAFLKSLFAGVLILAVAMLARPLLISALRIRVAAGGASAPPLPPGAAGAKPAGRSLAGGAWSPPAAPAQKPPEDMLDAMIDVRRIDGKINAASAKRLAQLLDRHPDLAAQAVRRWLAQGTDSR